MIQMQTFPMPAYNVLDEPWIPVVLHDGGKILCSLKDVFDKGADIMDLAVRPHERVALMRLLLCITHASIDGPQNHAEWKSWGGDFSRLVSSVLAYLAKHHDAFWLFHPEKPWLQFPDIQKTSSPKDSDADDALTPASKLNFAYASGENSTLFDHAAMDEERRIPLAETIVSMLAFQNFSPGGLTPQVYWKGKQSKKSADDAPCATQSMLHAFWRGKHLLETIHYNLPTYESVRQHYGEENVGRPVWECMPSGWEDGQNVDNATRTYLGRLVPLKRLMKLLPPDGHVLLLGDGFDFPVLEKGFPAEPTGTVVAVGAGTGKNKMQYRYLSYKPGKAVWRQLYALLVKDTQRDGRCLALRRANFTRDMDLLVAGLARKQADIQDHMESVYRIPASMLQEEGIMAYQNEVVFAEDVGKRLTRAVETYRNSVDGGWEGRIKNAKDKRDLQEKAVSQASILYWTRVERHLDSLWRYVKGWDGNDAERLQTEWEQHVQMAAYTAYENVCGRDTPRQIKAFSEGLSKLSRRGKIGHQENMDDGDDDAQKEDDE